MKTYCCTDNRRELIRSTTDLNGIEYVEVVHADNQEEQQKILRIQFLKELVDPIPEEHFYFSKANQLSGINVDEIISDPSEPSDSMTVRLSDRGDFSTYTLHLLENWEEKEALTGFDKLLSSVAFSFKVECFTDIDCKQIEADCSDSEEKQTPNINYLAKDYASFKQLILDRMSLVAPDWVERNPADLGMTLVEILAYVGDYLSYRQDAIGTEAYLQTARKRISVKRHARLVDYHMHDGVNARTWIHINVEEDSDGTNLKKIENGFKTKFITKSAFKKTDSFVLTANQFNEKFSAEQLVFEPVHDLQLFIDHNSISFHTYGNDDCCLPKGTSEATLVGRLENLKVNDVIILEEVRDPETGSEFDANPDHRHAIKVIDITFDTDFDFGSDPAEKIDITVIKWSDEDALLFPLCLSSKIASEEATELIDVSVARGNNLLVDHGYSYSDLDEINTSFPFESIQGSLLPNLVPESKYTYATQNASHCEQDQITYIRPRFTPIINAMPLTQSEPLHFDNEDASDLLLPASKMITQNPRKATPIIKLMEIVDSGEDFDVLSDSWQPVKDLLIDSSNLDQHFVVEVDSSGKSYLRFGNDINGKFPNSGSKFVAEYRIGNGSVGNIGRNTIQFIATNQDLKISGITNPLPARGGINPESKKEVKQYAPQSFRTQERAVTISDYETIAKRCKDDLQSVSASLRWTGSWSTAYITADRLSANKVTPQWEQELINCLQRYRLTGLDLEIDEPHYIGVELSIEVCVYPDQLKADIHAEITNLLSSQVVNGKKGFFHPDNLVFGQTLFLSKIYSIVQNIDGVQSVDINRFQRFGIADSSGLGEGKLEFGKKEIARLDNNPNQRDMGVLSIQIKGGR